jgi:single-strand DNA-binding protein
MVDFNRVILAGRLVRDPEMRYTPSGTAVASFSLAVNRRSRQEGGELKEEVSFIDVVAFGKVGETSANYLKKGRAVLLEGRIQQRRWETKEGEKRSKVEVVANLVQFLDPRREEGAGESSSGSSANVVDDDIPF